MNEAAQDPGAAGAATDPLSADPRLQGRTYAIPFERVWSAAVALAGGGLSRWRILKSDDHLGVILAVSTSAVLKHTSDVRITVSLDANGQTRVDLRATTRDGKGGPRHNVRSIDTFIRHLDRKTEARPGLILDATAAHSWSA